MMYVAARRSRPFAFTNTPIRALVLLVALLSTSAACRTGEQAVEGPCCAEAGADAAHPVADMGGCDSASAADASGSTCAAAGASGSVEGMRVYVDPETGELLETPPPGAQPPPGPAAQDAAEPRVKPLPGGGVALENGESVRQY